jgi:hypothetical protein
MAIFLLILFSVPVVAMLWWLWAHRRLRHAPWARWWQAAVAAFSLTFLLTFAWVLAARITGLPISPHAWLMAMLMIWGMMFLPLLGVPSMMLWGHLAGRAVGHRIVQRSEVGRKKSEADVMRRRMMKRSPAGR